MAGVLPEQLQGVPQGVVRVRGAGPAAPEVPDQDPREHRRRGADLEGFDAEVPAAAHARGQERVVHDGLGHGGGADGRGHHVPRRAAGDGAPLLELLGEGVVGALRTVVGEGWGWCWGRRLAWGVGLAVAVAVAVGGRGWGCGWG